MHDVILKEVHEVILKAEPKAEAGSWGPVLRQSYQHSCGVPATLPAMSRNVVQPSSSELTCYVCSQPATCAASNVCSQPAAQVQALPSRTRKNSRSICPARLASPRSSATRRTRLGWSFIACSSSQAEQASRAAATYARRNEAGWVQLQATRLQQPLASSAV